MSFIETGSLQDMELRYSSLERENFDLKMQIYYLNQKLSDLSKTAPSELSDTTSDVFAARSPSHEILNSIPTTDFERNIKSLPHIDKNWQRERGAIIAIAEQDGLIMRRLQEDIVSLQQQLLKTSTELEGYKRRSEVLTNDNKELRDLLVRERQKSESRATPFTGSEQPPPPHVTGIDSSIRMNSGSLQNRPPSAKGDTDFTLIMNSLDASREIAASPKGLTPQRSSHVSNAVNNIPHLDLSVGRRRIGNTSSRYDASAEVERLRAQLMAQEEALRRVQEASAEISLLEAEEICRLEAELDHCIHSKERLQHRCRALESQLELRQYKQEKAVVCLDTERDNEVEETGTGRFDLDDEVEAAFKAAAEAASVVKTVQRATATRRRRKGDHQITTERQTTKDDAPYSYERRLRNSDENDSGDMNIDRSISQNVGGRDASPYPEHQRMLEMYRQREVELMRALEGVVLRCQQLETQLNGVGRF